MECRTCHIDKPLSDFAKNSKNVSGHSYRCNTCMAAYQLEYKKRPKVIVEALVCTACNVEKPVSEYHKDAGKKTGYSSQCKACSAIKHAEYTAANHDALLAKKAVYRSTHRKELLAAQAVYYAEHRQIYIDRTTQWRQDNPARMRTMGVQHANRRRARLLNAPVNDFTAEQFEEMKAVYKYRCVYCPVDCKACKNKTHALVQDHITPLAKGGSNTASNIVPACRSCNAKKHTKEAPVPVQPLLLTLAPPKPSPDPSAPSS